MIALVIVLWLWVTACSMDWTSHNHLRVVWFHRPQATEMEVERMGDNVILRRRTIPEGVLTPCPPSD